MSFNYLSFWSCEDEENTQLQNSLFKDKVKDDKPTPKPLLTNKLIIIENKNTSLNDFRERDKDMKNYFINNERKTLKLLKKG